MTVQQFWGTFMQEVQVASDHHPYLVRPGADDYAGWAFAGAVGASRSLCWFCPAGLCIVSSLFVPVSG